MQEEISSALKKIGLPGGFNIFFVIFHPLSKLEMDSNFDVFWYIYYYIFRFFGWNLTKTQHMKTFWDLFCSKINSAAIFEVHGSILVVRSSRWNVPGRSVRVFWGWGVQRVKEIWYMMDICSMNIYIYLMKFPGSLNRYILPIGWLYIPGN